MPDSYDLKDRILVRCKVIAQSRYTKELLDDTGVEIYGDEVQDIVAFRLVKSLWGFITDRQPGREGVAFEPLSRWEHLKRALLPKRFATWHELDNGQPIFERVYLTLGDEEPMGPQHHKKESI